MYHELKVRIYYEDTDAGGVVYHANYMNYMLRGRTELMRDLEMELDEIHKEHGALFVVKNANLDFNAPAVLDDELTVRTCVAKLGGSSITFLQEIIKNNRVIVKGEIVIVSVNMDKGRAIRLPKEVRTKFEKFITQTN